MTIVNCTPHAIDILGDDDVVVASIPASGTVARTNMVWEYVETVEGFTVGRNTYGDIVGLPDPQEGMRYIVSLQVAMAAKDRTDLLVPGPSVRKGSVIVGCKGLSVL